MVGRLLSPPPGCFARPPRQTVGNTLPCRLSKDVQIGVLTNGPSGSSQRWGSPGNALRKWPTNRMGSTGGGQGHGQTERGAPKQRVLYRPGMFLGGNCPIHVLRLHATLPMTASVKFP